ncbi:MAG: putative RNA methylase family protein [Microgenomates group bacterium Gr01-1014_16]|nr:MAG: putative RNA methylase family protein [Microgenomates group bacterium Gr01-1014_16]
MFTYFSTFITGLNEVVSDALKKSVSSVRIEQILDGLIVYKTNVNPRQIRELRFFNNSFVLLETVRGNVSDDTLKKLVDKVTGVKIQIPVEKRTSFRIMFSKENQPVSVEPKILQSLEKKFASKDLSVNRTSSGVELLFLARSDGYGFFGLRLTRHGDYKKTLHPGELRPELANLLCCLSDPTQDDVFLDPFAGYGAIPIERAVSFPYKRIYAGDIVPNLVSELKQKASKLGKRFIIGQLDATKLNTFSDSSISKIVTDPPWGIYSSGKNFD